MNFHLGLPAALVLCLSAIAQTQHKPSPPPAAKPAESAEQVYRNAAFGFRYRIPYGWVDRTKDMQEGSDAAKGEVLLAIFERPPQAAGDSINSAAVIAAENAANYPGLKKAEDYLGPLTEVTTSQGFKADGDPSEVQIDSQRLVRIDFTKALNEKIAMHQSTLVQLVKGQIVSFTFIADSADAVNDLIDRVNFSASKSKAK
jgi:hypothetical protein